VSATPAKKLPELVLISARERARLVPFLLKQMHVGEIRELTESVMIVTGTELSTFWTSPVLPNTGWRMYYNAQNGNCFN
jgi:hypothetical protein